MTKLDSRSLVPISRLLVTARADAETVCSVDDRDVPWAALTARVGAVAAAAAARPESRWLVAAADAFEFCICLLALLQAGKRAVIAPNLAAGTLRDLSGAYDARIGTAVDSDLDTWLEPASPWTPTVPSTELPLIELFTSGSAGTPKRISKCLRQLETEVDALERCWGEAAVGATFLSTVSHHHIYGMLFWLLWPLCSRRPFDATLYAEPSRLSDAVGRRGKVVLISSPAHLNRLPDLLELAPLRGSVQRIFSSGAPLPPATAQSICRDLGEAPTEVYGSTETGGIGWRQWSAAAEADLWTPFPDIRFVAASADEHRLRSPYLENPTEDFGVDDRIEVSPDGRFRLGPRLDRVVKVEGKRVALPDMENHLRQHPWVNDAAIVMISRGRDELGAAVALRPDVEEQSRLDRRSTTAELREHLRAWH